MKILLRLFLLLLAISFEETIMVASPSKMLLPMPQHVTWQKGVFNPRVAMQIQVEDAQLLPLIKRAGLQTSSSIENETSTKKIIYRSLPTSVKSSEAYQLRITPDSMVVCASAWEGFFYAKTTLEQLRDEKGNYPCCEIVDEPTYRWRGAMVDVSRHFYPLEFLQKQVDILSQYKINRLHLHLTDAAGWRMEIKRYPRLTSFAAWRTDSLWKTWWNDGKRSYVPEGTRGAYGGYYTQAELSHLVQYAAERAITIVPEIEMPAHSEEVLTAYPELSCTHVPYKQADFCPGSVATYDFLEHVLEEVMDVFPSTFIHVGGDEAGKASWGTCALCQQRMKEKGYQDVNELQAGLIRHFGEFLHSHGRRLIGWDEIIDSTLEENSAVMVWRQESAALDAIRLGHEVVLSPGAFCYLDGYQDSPPTQPEAYGGYRSLEMVYNYIPDAAMNEAERSKILGIQGNLWTEYVPTASHAEYMLYPRILALAEIAWKGGEKNYADFKTRMLLHIDSLHAKGVNAFDLKNEVGNRPGVGRVHAHKAYGCKVTYHRVFNEKYCAQKEATLTDGILGGWNYGDQCWQGFIGRNYLDVTLDLGSVKRIKEIGTDFLQCSGPDIFFPASYHISVSTDGVHFKEIMRREHTVSRLPLNAIELWTWKGSERARYIRVQAQASKEMGGWIFADEIMVY